MRCRNNAVGIIPVAVIALENVACLAEILHAQRHNVPVERLTDNVQPCPHPLDHNPVQRFGVMVDVPPAIADVVFPTFPQILEKIDIIKALDV